LDFLAFLQEHSSPVLERFFLVVTGLADMKYLLGAMMILYWCVRKDIAYRMGFSFMTASLLNGILKMTFMAPRPWMRAYQPSITRLYPALDAASGYSFPSGHAMGFTAFFLPLLRVSRKLPPKVLACTAIVLVVVSRLYLRVHTPLDVLTGVALGGAMFLFTDRLYLYMQRTGKHYLALWGIAGAALSSAYAVLMLNRSSLDESALSGVKDIMKVAGGTTGMCISYYLEQRFIGFSEQAPIYLQMIKCAVGAIGLVAVLYGLEQILPDKNSFYLLRYLLASLWAMAVMPWIIRKYLHPRKLKT